MLSSKYFYDEKGSAIFEAIMRMPEYYLTNCEAEILKEQASKIVDALPQKPVRVIEFGSGDGTKTIHILRALTGVSEATYIPVDISGQSIQQLSINIHKALPDQKIEPFLGDYFSFTTPQQTGASLFLFLGSNIGNYTKPETQKLLAHFYANMKPGDQLLIGFDLQKDPQVILQAYDDPQGITKAFNLNLLERMNRELGADFKIDQFDFTVTYNTTNGELKSYLKSLEKQVVQLDDQIFSFEKNELIWTELSKKYMLSEIEQIAAANQFTFQQHFLDTRSYFAVSLWEK